MRMEIQITTPQNTKEPTIFGLFILTIIAIFRGVTYLFSPQRQFIGQIWRIYINREKAYQKPNNITLPTEYAVRLKKDKKIRFTGTLTNVIFENDESGSIYAWLVLKFDSVSI